MWGPAAILLPETRLAQRLISDSLLTVSARRTSLSKNNYLWGTAMEGPLIVFSVLAFVAFFIWNRTKDSLERRRLQLDAQARMLESIGPGEALTEFLKTDEGQRFFNQLTASPSRRALGKDPRTLVFVLITFGLIALFGGFVAVNAILIPNLVVDEPEMPTDVLALISAPAFLLTGAGIGALVAAWIMHRLSKRHGMHEAQEAEVAAE